MPLVQISVLRNTSRDHVRAIADGVHRALVEGFGVPPDDRFQLVHRLDREDFIYDADYLGIHRSDDLVMITIIASNWRGPDQKKDLYRRIVANLTDSASLRPEDVLVTLVPNEREDWSFGNGLASYVKEDGT